MFTNACTLIERDQNGKGAHRRASPALACNLVDVRDVRWQRSAWIGIEQNRSWLAQLDVPVIDVEQARTHSQTLRVRKGRNDRAGKHGVTLLDHSIFAVVSSELHHTTARRLENHFVDAVLGTLPRRKRLIESNPFCRHRSLARCLLRLERAPSLIELENRLVSGQL